MKSLLTIFALFGLANNLIKIDELRTTISTGLDFWLVMLAPLGLLFITLTSFESSYSEELQYIKPILGKLIGVVVVVGGFILMFAYPFENRTNSAPSSNQKYFRGYSCSDDCSGHEAGYDWAKENRIEYVSDCSGNSGSFIEGCEAWVKSSPPPFPDRE